MESGVLFLLSSDDVGLFTRIFCRYSYIGVYLKNDSYSITIINPFLLIEPRTYYLNRIKELFEVSSENIDTIFIKKCNLTVDNADDLKFEGYLTKKGDFVDVIGSLLVNDQIGIEAINELFTRLYPDFKFNYNSIKEYEQSNDIFGPKIEIVNFYSDRKAIPLTIVNNIGDDFDLVNSIKRGIESIDLSSEIKHIKIDILLDTFNHLNKIFGKNRDNKHESLNFGSHPAVLTVGSRNRELAIEFNDQTTFILTSNATQINGLSKEHKKEILQFIDIQSDGSLHYENIRKHIYNNM